MYLSDEQKELVENNINLVWDVIHRQVYVGEDDIEDLFQCGCLALCEAAYRFDSSLGFKFSTFAEVTILNEIRTYKNRIGIKYHGMKVPNSIIDSNREIEIYAMKNQLDLSDFNDIAEIERKLGLKYSSTIVKSINENIKVDDESITFGDLLSDALSEDAFDYIVADADFCILKDKYLEKVSGKSYEVIDYIFNTYRDYGYVPKHRVLATKFNTSRANISRILTNFKNYVFNNYK